MNLVDLIKRGKIELLLEALERGIDPNLSWGTENGNTPLILAVTFKKNDAVRLLLKYRANPNKANYYGETPLHWAVWSRNYEAMDILLDAGGNPNAQSEIGTPLHLACHKKDPKAVEILIKGGSDPKARASGLDGIGDFTPLHSLAEMKGVSEIPDPETGENIWMHTPNPQRASMILYNSTKQIAEILLSSGADLEARDKAGRTPLTIACVYGRAEIVKALLPYGPNPYIRDEYGFSPLNYVAKTGNAEIASLFIESGVYMYPQDEQGKVPWDYVPFEKLADFIELGLFPKEKQGTIENIIQEISDEKLVKGLTVLATQEPMLLIKYINLFSLKPQVISGLAQRLKENSIELPLEL